VHKYFPVDQNAEITLEANPDDINGLKINELKQAGINRLSIGVQSFIDKDLKFLERRHSGSQAKDCIELAQDAGFHNLSIDLIYGIPTLENSGWESNLRLAIETGVPHISAYALTVEEKTPLSLRIKQGKLPDVDDEKQLAHFNILTTLLHESGYEHYEISNFCKPGMYSKHNTSYWQGKKYLGIGPSAHSYNKVSRQWNVANLGDYIHSLKKGEVSFEREVLTKSQRYNEYIMTSLRTMWGCDLDMIEMNFGTEFAEQAHWVAKQFLENGMLSQQGQILRLTDNGLFHADGIASEFFKVD
jgi:oxygen-independent coproporphyrinogen-3 oxidase